METEVRRVAVRLGKEYQQVLWAEIDNADEFRKLEDKELDGYKLIIKKVRKSKNMNSYMWVLCNQIALKMKPMTKEDVYRLAVRNVGKWVDVEVGCDEVEPLKRSWMQNGEGWFCEPLMMGKDKATIRCYIGSSTYDADELYRLTEYVVEEAKELGIDTATPSDLEHMKKLWGEM